LVAWISILFPGFTQAVANLLGVGRGADLIFYFFGLFTTFALILLYTRDRIQSHQLTELIRHLAIRDAIVSPPAQAPRPPAPP